MVFFLRLFMALPLFLATSSLVGYHWPSPMFDAIEALLYEDAPEPSSNPSLTDLLNDCQPANNISKAAEWVRFAYHDMATHNVVDGTGGLDGSLYYELDRAENVGGGMVTTKFDLISSTGKYVSKADVIAIGLVVAIAECGGPTIPFRMGRVDASAAGPSGVPRPEQDLAEHTESFRRQGFTPTEMIGLVACGHTLGGIRFPDFPEIVPPPQDASSNGEELIPFDTTPNMDNVVVTQYLNGMTPNLLVVHPNKTITSDFRIFNSDRNDTMKKLVSPKVFAQTCQDLLERMINTVPKGIQLSDVIMPLQVKVDAVQLSVTNNALRLKAMLRLSMANPKRKVTMFWENRTGGSCKRGVCSAPVVSTNDATRELTRRLGMSPQKYRFDTPINATTSISKFWFEVDEGNGSKPSVLDNGGSGYQITQDRVLFDTGRSGFDFANNVSNIIVVAAVRNDILPSRVYANIISRDTDNPQNGTFELAPAPEISSTAGHNFYKMVIPSFGFMFDLFSVVNGKQCSEDGRNTGFIDPLTVPGNLTRRMD